MPHNMSDEDIRLLVKGAVAEAIEDIAPRILSTDEHEWVRLAMKRAARQEEFRDKVLNSTAIGVVWVFLASIATAILVAVKEYMISHGMWRP